MSSPLGVMVMRATRFVLAVSAAACVAAAATVHMRAAGPQSFTFLQAGFTQQLYGTTHDFVDTDNGLLGGVAFAARGDPLVAECLFSGTRLHRYAAAAAVPPVHMTATLRPETIISNSADARGFGGC